MAYIRFIKFGNLFGWAIRRSFHLLKLIHAFRLLGVQVLICHLAFWILIEWTLIIQELIKIYFWECFYCVWVLILAIVMPHLATWSISTHLVSFILGVSWHIQHLVVAIKIGHLFGFVLCLIRIWLMLPYTLVVEGFHSDILNYLTCYTFGCAFRPGC